MERKVFSGPFELKIDAEQGIVSGIAAVFGNVDEGGDVIVKGAFKKTIKEHLKRMKLCFGHDQSWPIGKILALREVDREELPQNVQDKFPEATGGLYYEAKVSKTSSGLDALELVRDGVIDENSIGFDPINDPKGEVDGRAVRLLKEVRLWEISMVTWGMNPATAITGLKAKEGEEEAKPDLTDSFAAISAALEDRKSAFTRPDLSTLPEALKVLSEMKKRLQEV